MRTSAAVPRVGAVAPRGPVYDPAAMAIGIITGSGTYALPGLEAGEAEEVATPSGAAHAWQRVRPGLTGEPGGRRPGP